jgi:NAD(P)-dependent dehydrogenase (short-subunit alcohol dehydrogenase family)
VNALIQGASRGIGLALCRRLLAHPEVERVFATTRRPEGCNELGELARESGGRLVPLALDVEDEASIENAATNVGAEVDRLHLLYNVAGLLHDGSQVQPEKKLEQVDPAAMARLFAVNSTGPLLVAKHFWPLLAHDQRAVLANMSARVGSIGDNRMGGWYGYRASKAAQNMVTRNLSIELGRRAPNAIVVALHPGTVDTGLSKPFQRNVPAGKLFGADDAAGKLLAVIDGLTEADTGGYFDWAGEPIVW